MKQLLFILLLGLFNTLLALDKPLDLKAVLKSSQVSIDYEALEAGEIIYTSREDLETTDTSIAVVMGLYVKGSYKDVLADFKAQNNQLSSYSDSIVVEIRDLTNVQPYFQRVGFSNNENEEIQKLFSYDKGEEFNFSDVEISALENVTKSKELTSQNAGAFFQELLKVRTQKYLAEGVSGISTYEHSDEDTSVQNDIKTSSLHFHVMQKHFPKLYKDYLNYPDVKSDVYEQKFYWLKDKIEDRVTFTLKHQMVEEKNNFFIILERQFYISNGLDTLQTQILCMPYKKGTFIALSSQSFTPKVAGWLRLTELSKTVPLSSVPW